ncbi:MAG: restriction endonuclease subunit S [Bacteroidaceae bacterium]|nr:restriction endonuclease subunit S [Bacteroidaceae bacterium]
MMQYERLGDYIREVNVRNRDEKVTNLLGLSVSKEFMPSIANTIGTDMSTYKIVKKNQLVYIADTSRRGDKIAIALLKDYESAIVSQAYTVFEIIDSNKLLPKYLMMWFLRPEFDRYARFHSHGSAREIFDWDELCNVMIPLPSIDRQHEIVEEYETLSRRISLNEQMIQELEATAQALYRKMFVDGIDKENLPDGWRMGTLGEVCSKIGSGSTPKGGKDSYQDSGVSLIRSMNVFDFNFSYEELAHISDRQAKQLDGVAVNKKDILFNITGASVARCCMVPDEIIPARVNQHVMIIRAKDDYMPYYLLCSLCSDDAKQSLLGMSQSGSTREAITKAEIDSFHIVIPSQELLMDFTTKVEVLYQNVMLYKQETSKLKELQSLLLAKMGNLKQKSYG